MKKLFVAFAFVLLLFTTAHAAELIKIWASGYDVNIRHAPSMKGEVSHKINTGGEEFYVAEAQEIYNQSEKMGWYKILYYIAYDNGAEDDEDAIHIAKVEPLYISSKFTKKYQFNHEEKARFLRDFKVSIK